ELLHHARPVLIDFCSENRDLAGRIPLFHARYEGAWELPVIGAVMAPAAVLIRPDGYVAWVGDGTDAGLAEALDTWIGRLPPSGQNDS
ncbi:MAG TPA: hypothetical protein VKJ07_16815, partial [Mycobacteriales bacterium]|nr:hypothetical protein [Mycobacteriales bacterium]